jgi:hypothetical protein
MSPETGVTQGSPPLAAVTLPKEDSARVTTSRKLKNGRTNFFIYPPMQKNFDVIG